MNAKRVLVVDDHEDMLECLAVVLGKQFDVTLAAGGAAAMKYLQTEAFDAVLLDLTMPEVDGFDVLEFLTAHRPEVRVMLASALPNVEEVARRFGARDWLYKPYRVELLPQRIMRMFTPQLARP